MGKSDGTFGGPDIQRIGPEPVQVEKADFNADGDLDLVILSVGSVGYLREYQQSLYVLEGNGNGRFGEEGGGSGSSFVRVFDVTDKGACFEAGDFNGDGRPDLALLEPAESRIRLAFNTTQSEETAFGEPGASPLAVPGGAEVLAAYDFDDSADDDLAVAFWDAENGGRVDILLSDGEGGFTQKGSGQITTRASCMAVDSLAGNSRTEVVVGGEAPGGGSGEVSVVSVAGDGSVGEPAVSGMASVPSDVALGDLNGDEIEDLVFVQPDSRLLTSFPVTFSSEPGAPFIRGDANGDGKPPDISDAIKILLVLFEGEPVDCREALDVNDDFKVDIGDGVYLLNFLFTSGPQPPPPFPEAGEDPNEETLGCERSE